MSEALNKFFVRRVFNSSPIQHPPSISRGYRRRKIEDDLKEATFQIRGLQDILSGLISGIQQLFLMATPFEEEKRVHLARLLSPGRSRVPRP